MSCHQNNTLDDDMSLADIMSLKINKTLPKKDDKKITMDNLAWNDWSLQNEMYQQQLQSSYYQLQYLQQQQMMMMMRNSTSSRRSSTVSSTSSNASRYHSSYISPSNSNSSVKHYRSEPKRTAVAPINTSRTNRANTSSTISTPTSTASPASPATIELPKRRQSLGKRIKKVFGMAESPVTPTQVSDEKKAAELPTLIRADTTSASTKSKARKNTISLPASPNSSIASRHHHHHHHHQPQYHHRHGRPQLDTSSLPSPASSTVSTSTSSSKKSLSFSPVIKLHETFSAVEYDRRCDTNATCQKLTPVLALRIKEELNNFKLNDMSVHIDSRQNTHFFM